MPLKDLGTAEKISAQAADRAGNKSQTAQVTNPNYQAPSGSVGFGCNGPEACGHYSGGNAGYALHLQPCGLHDYASR